MLFLAAGRPVSFHPLQMILCGHLPVKSTIRGSIMISIGDLPRHIYYRYRGYKQMPTEDIQGKMQNKHALMQSRKTNNSIESIMASNGASLHKCRHNFPNCAIDSIQTTQHTNQRKKEREREHNIL